LNHIARLDKNIFQGTTSIGDEEQKQERFRKNGSVFRALGTLEEKLNSTINQLELGPTRLANTAD